MHTNANIAKIKLFCAVVSTEALQTAVFSMKNNTKRAVFHDDSDPSTPPL